MSRRFSLWGSIAKSAPTTATTTDAPLPDRTDRDWEDVATPPSGRRSEAHTLSDADVQSLEGSKTQEDLLAEKHEIAELRDRCAGLQKQVDRLTRKNENFIADNTRLREQRERKAAEHVDALKKRDEQYAKELGNLATENDMLRRERARRETEYAEAVKMQDGQLGDELKRLVAENNELREEQARKEAEFMQTLKQRDTQYSDELNKLLADKGRLSDERVRKEAEYEELRKRDRERADELNKLLAENSKLRDERSRTGPEYEELRKRDREHADELKKLEREHRDELRRRDSTHRIAVDEINTARRTAEDERQKLSEKLVKYKKRYEDDCAYIASLLDQNKALERRVRDTEHHAAALEDALHVANRDLMAFKRDADQHAQDAKSLRDERTHTRKQLDQTLNLLDIRSAELKGAQTFLTIADAASGTQIIDALKRLNNEIMQVAAFLAEATLEAFEFAFAPTPATSNATAGETISAEDRAYAIERATAFLGPKMVEHLGAKNHADEPILLQIAFQALLARVFHWVVGAWVIGDPTLDDFLAGLYGHVKTTVFGKWRAMTRAHLLAAQPDRSRALTHISNTLLDGLACVLVAAQCMGPPSTREISKKLAVKYGQRFNVVSGIALEVSRLVGEDVTSSEYAIAVEESGAVFDPERMEDAYDDGPARGGAGAGAKMKKERVLCPTDLGLVQSTKIGAGREGKWDHKMLLKPKVALESVVDFMDE